jgi:UDP-glucose 4-epimerase
MKLIIVGHTGFIGKNIYQNLINNSKYEIVGISTNQVNLLDNNSSHILSEIIPSNSVVIMCVGIKKQLGDNLEIFRDNLSIIKNFSEAMIKSKPAKILFISSTSVYGEDVVYDHSISEETPVQPRTYYGIAKYTAERILKKVCRDNQLHLMILRPPLVYGKDDLSMGYGPTGFTYKYVNGEKIILWGNGSEYREFIYIDDVGKIICRLINNNFSGTLNLVSGKSYTYEDVLNKLKKITNSHINIESRKRSKDKVDHHYSNKLIQTILGGFRFTILEEGLNKTYRAIIN